MKRERERGGISPLGLFGILFLSAFVIIFITSFFSLIMFAPPSNKETTTRPIQAPQGDLADVDCDVFPRSTGGSFICTNEWHLSCRNNMCVKVAGISVSDCSQLNRACGTELKEWESHFLTAKILGPNLVHLLKWNGTGWATICEGGRGHICAVSARIKLNITEITYTHEKNVGFAANDYRVNFGKTFDEYGNYFEITPWINYPLNGTIFAVKNSSGYPIDTYLLTFNFGDIEFEHLTPQTQYHGFNFTVINTDPNGGNGALFRKHLKVRQKFTEVWGKGEYGYTYGDNIRFLGSGENEQARLATIDYAPEKIRFIEQNQPYSDDYFIASWSNF